jgi:hypothetical protein
MKTTAHNKGGRPRTGHASIPAVRLPRALFVRLERRLLLIELKTGMKNVSKFVRQALIEKLNREDARDHRERLKKTRRAK